MNAINSTFIFSNREILRKKIKTRLSNSDIRGALSDVTEYTQNFPTEKEVLVAFYALVLNEFGSTSAAKSVAKLIADANDKTCKFAKNYFNLEPVVNTSWMLGRIGEMADQTASIHHLLTLKHIKKKPILPILQTNTLSNSAFLPYLEDVFHVLNGGEEARYYSQYSNISSFNTTFIKYSNDVYGHYSDAAPGVHKILTDQNLPHFAFTLKEVTKIRALEYLKQFGLKAEDNFVTLHLRESGFVDDERHDWRNVKLQDHIEAIEYLTKQGIKVVRIGHNKMTKAPELSGLIDLVNFVRPPEVDIFLSASCLFYYGNPSGPCSLAYQFGRPMLYSNVFPYTHVRANSLNQIVPLREVSSSKILSLKELLERDISNIFSPIPYKRKGIEICKISSHENISAVKQMLKNIESLNKRLPTDILKGTGLPNNIWITEESQQLI